MDKEMKSAVRDMIPENGSVEVSVNGEQPVRLDSEVRERLTKELAEEKDRGCYAVIPARLLKAVQAAKGIETPHALNDVLVCRERSKIMVVGCDGSVMVAIETPADKTLFGTGQKSILPRALVDAAVKIKAKREDTVEIVDAPAQASLTFSNGVTMDRAKANDTYPSYTDLIRIADTDVEITVSLSGLATVLKTIAATCPGAEELTFHGSRKRGQLHITARAGDEKVIAVLAGGSTVLVETPKPEKPAGE
jgi:hypothetical protein